MSVRITDKDNGFKSLLVRVREFRRGATVSVGVNDEPHAGRGNLTNAQLGAIHEFGLGVPRRSFLRAWVDDRGWAAKLRGLVVGVVFGLSRRQDVLEDFGKYAVDGVRQRIRDHIDPPLAEDTIRRKGGEDTPLVDTEQLIDAVEYEVGSR